MNRRVRLPLLIACLGVAIVALLGAQTDVFSRASAEGQANRHPCQGAAPALAQISIPEFAFLRTSLLPVMAPLAKRRYAWGAVSTEDVWSDNYPRRIDESRSPDGGFSASFEMRVWAETPRELAGFDIGADVFLFADAGHARRFFKEAASTRCHRNGSALPASQPPRTMNLVWDNPDNALQADAFLLRGSRVYRVSAVPPNTGHPEAMKRAAIAAVNRLACELAEAGCTTRAKRAEPSPGAARPSARAASRRPSDRATDAGRA